MAQPMTRVITTPAAASRPHDRARPFVSMLTDWGVGDPYAAICHGVVLNIAPDALIVDVTHEIEKFNIRHGALMLSCALAYLPVGAHIAVVDPGVGTARRPVALETARGDYLVGPDNGLLLPGAHSLGGVVRAHRIENVDYRLPVVTSTFHGRDLFSPAAAHLVMGVPIEAIGPALDPSDLVEVGWPPVAVADGTLQTSVIYIDSFGNIKLGAAAADLREGLPGLEHGDLVEVSIEGAPERRRIVWAATFGEVAAGEYLLYEDSYGRLCIGQNQGNAAESLPLAEGAVVTVRRAAQTTE